MTLLWQPTIGAVEKRCSCIQQHQTVMLKKTEFPLIGNINIIHLMLSLSHTKTFVTNMLVICLRYMRKMCDNSVHCGNHKDFMDFMTCD